ncbi:hypothetical protein [Streptomyces sp. NPDC001502]|uniref:hypothetical protein n=1 Tax=Streptomyces sp. NPDC001502 TaxID=3364578 RepID=UPI0036B61F71
MVLRIAEGGGVRPGEQGELSDDPKVTVIHRPFSRSGGAAMVMVQQEAYRRELEYLIQYAHDDWLGFSVVSGSVGSLLGRGASFEAQLGLLLRIVGDLYDAGARAGDLTESTREPFLQWRADKAEVLMRIAAEAEPHSRLPDSGDVCWFTVP